MGFELESDDEKIKFEIENDDEYNDNIKEEVEDNLSTYDDDDDDLPDEEYDNEDEE